MPPRPSVIRRIVLAAQADGLPTVETFRLEEAPVPDLSDGQVLTRTLCFSVDPGTRSRLSSGASYAPPLRVGETIDGFCIGQVVESLNPRFSEGDLVAMGGGWADHCIFSGRGYIQKIPHDRLPLSYWIGVLGVPGMTAWFGLHRVAGLKTGDRLLITSAAGPVGATAAQIARVKGAGLVVGLARGSEKALWLRSEARLDAVIDYALSPDLTADLKHAGPEGYDCLFDNVGPEMIDRVIPLMRPGGRIVISGQLADYNARPGEARGLMNSRYFISSRLRMEGLVVFDDLRGFPAAQNELSGMIEAGDVRVREIRYSGLEAAPAAFIDLFTGLDFGRRIVDIAAPSV